METVDCLKKHITQNFNTFRMTGLTAIFLLLLYAKMFPFQEFFFWRLLRGIPSQVKNTGMKGKLRISCLPPSPIPFFG